MRPVTVLCIVLFLLSTPARADTPAGRLDLSDMSAPAVEITGEQPRLRTRNWYVGLGATNYHPRLRESEAQIDRQINRLFAWLPSWERPTTFADWRDRFFLWDMTVGAGTDVSRKTTLMVWTGGATGTIKNKARYGLFATDIRFTRTTFFVVPEFFYYPLGKIDYETVAGTRGCARVRAALAGAKPYAALAGGYSFVRAEADVKFKMPVIGTFFRQKQSDDHHMYLISPRIGVELPVGANTSIAPVVMYLFQGPDYSREYNGPALSISVRHRF